MSHQRKIISILSAPFQIRHWRALVNSLLFYQQPIAGLYRYIARPESGYPRVFGVRTPTGDVFADLYHPDDMLTINEIFCRGDYKADTNIKVVADFGSNIGISALYFLSRNTEAFCYLFEPNPKNTNKIRHQLRFFEDRYELNECGVAPESGELEFGFEPIGRYGGAGLDFPDKQIIEVKAAESVLQDMIKKHGEIDILKIDIESMELEIVKSLSKTTLQKIKTLFVEYEINENILSETHDFVQYGPIAIFTRR